MKTLKTLALILFSITVISACKTTSSSSGISSGKEKERSEKTIAIPSPLKGITWELIELGGRPIAANQEPTPEIIFSDTSNRVYGNSGCNRFFGTYTLDANKKRLTIGQVGSTMMACPNMNIEQEFLEVLKKADSYILQENSLILLKARMAPLAKFKVKK